MNDVPVSTISELTSDFLVRVVDDPTGSPVEKLIPGSEVASGEPGGTPLDAEEVREIIVAFIQTGNALTAAHNDEDDILLVSLTGDAGDIAFESGEDLVATDVAAALDELATGKADADHAHMDSVNIRHYDRLTIPGPQATGIVEAPWFAYVDATIEAISVAFQTGDGPSGAAYIIDAHLDDGTTIFTTQGNRASVASGGEYDVSGTPDIQDVDAGHWLNIHVDQTGSAPGPAFVTIIWLEATA